MGFTLTSTSLAANARAKLWRIEAKNRERVSGEGSIFDPMNDIFQNKRIKIVDLVNPYNQIVIGKKFIECEIIGPANLLIIFTNAKFVKNHFEHSDSIEIRDKAIPQNAIVFVDCDFESCRFFKVSMLFQSSSRKAADDVIKYMNWLTAIDEPPLELEDASDTKGLRRLFRRIVDRDFSS